MKLADAHERTPGVVVGAVVVLALPLQALVAEAVEEVPPAKTSRLHQSRDLFIDPKLDRLDNYEIMPVN